MPRLALTITANTDSEVELEGAIFAQNAKENAPALVSDVFASRSRGSNFVLEPGKYAYRFHFDRGGGKVSVVVENLDETDPKKATQKSDAFDAAVATYNRVFRFEVKPASPAPSGEAGGAHD